jgi:hypothetical protein
MAGNVSGGYNVFVGMGAGEGQTASNNLGIGYQTLYSASGTQNVGVGNYTLRQVSTGQLNTAVGYNSSRNTDQGVNNVSVGHDSLYTNTTGNYNVAIGQASLRNNTTASNNTALGYQALYNQTTASGGHNTAIGGGALYTVSTGYQNVAIGYNALKLATGIYNTAVGDNAGGAINSGSRNTILGTYDGNSGGLDIRTSSNNIVLSDGAGNVRAHCDSSGQWDIARLENEITGSSSTRSSGVANYDTGIYGNTSVTGYQSGAMYDVFIHLNPNSGGSGSYKGFLHGILTVGVGWVGAISNRIWFDTLVTHADNSIGSDPTVSAYFWNGTTESTEISQSNNTTYQIRLAIGGYVSGGEGTGTQVNITRRI